LSTPELRTLVFDTETTGRAELKQPLAGQPGIVQLAAILFHGRRPLSHLSFVMQPERRGTPIEVSEEVSGIHGIYQHHIDAVGVPYRVGLAAFNNMVKHADRLVAHNIEFDHFIMRAAYSQIAADQSALLALPTVCTMKSSEQILKLPGKYGYKWPSLMEAHKHFLGEGFDGAHDAMVDVLACSRVLWALEDAGHPLKGI
jgi:DNA polymerase III epsilon subunit-like protein